MEGTDNAGEALPPLSRHGVTSPMGKCTAEVKVYLPPEMKDRAIAAAGRLGATPSEIGRDMFFMWLENMTYGEYVADSRRAALKGEGLKRGCVPDFQALRAFEMKPEPLREAA